VDEALAAGAAGAGRVVFVVAPDEADRLSLRAVQALNIADAVAPGPGAGAGDIVERHARRDAERLPAADPARLAHAAREGLLVVVVEDAADPLVLQALGKMGVSTTVLAPAP
jgi:hypothetical protein